MKKKISIALPIFIVTIILFIPIFVNPQLLLGRNNDLTEFFWPILNFIKKQLITNHELPLWNNQILGGTPLLPDPQSQLFYLPNLIFLILPIDHGFVVSLFLHLFAAGIGMYLCAKHGFKFSKYASLFTALIYLTTPKIAGYLEAGHYGLVCFMTYLPFVLLSVIKITEKININWSIAFAVSLAGCFFTHSLSFVITAIFSTIFFIYLFFEKKLKIKSLFMFILGAVITFGLIAISFLPQISWQPETTRYLLLQKPDVYPKWNSIIEPLKLAIFPWKNINNIDSEKWISLGVIPIIFSFLGFLKLNKNKKIYLTLLVIIILLISLNNASPIYSFLIRQNWYKLLRVSTRLWFIPIIIVSYLAGLLFEKTKTIKGKFTFLTLFASLAIIESIGLSWAYLKKPIIPNPNLASKEVYEFLSKDKDIFRVFCLNRCLSQKEASIYDLELLDGYSTLQQTNFYKQSWQFVQSYWDYYSLSFPPMGLYLFEEIKPHAESLGSYNVKYVISPYKINDSNFEFIKKIDRYYIFTNKHFLPRAYYWNTDQKYKNKLEISVYYPNHIKINVPKNKTNHIFLSEIYSQGWKTLLNGKKVDNYIFEKPDGLRVINIEKETYLVDIYYKPETYRYGKIITIITISIISVYFLVRKLMRNKITNKKLLFRQFLYKTIIVIPLLTSLLSVFYLIRVSKINSPLELREGGVLSSTYLLYKGLNPYSIKYMPSYTNVYGILYNLICLPFVKIFGLNFLSHRIISIVFILSSSFLIFKALKINKSSIFISILGFSILLTEISSKGYDVLARPDSVGLFLFLLSIFIPFWGKYSAKSLILSNFLSILAFLAKPYFIVSIFYTTSYVFIFKSKRKGLFFTFLSFVTVFITFFELNKYFETYFINTLFGHLEAAIKDKQHLIKQIKLFLIWNFPFIFIEIISILKLIKKIFAKKFRTFKKINLISYSLIISSVLVLFKMGLHTGNFMTYFTHLITPLLIVDSLTKVNLIKKIFTKSVLYILLSINIIYWFYQIVSSNLLLSSNSVYWNNWDKTIDSYSYIYNSPLITHLLIEKEISIYDNGQTEFYPLGLILNTTFNSNPKYWNEYQNYINNIKKNVKDGYFELITITKNEYKYFSREDLKNKYKLKEVNSIILFNDYWPTEVWVKK